MSKNGTFETIGCAGTACVGAMIGYYIGEEMIEYAKIFTENTDAINYFVRNHPTLTTLAAVVGTGSLVSVPGRIGGILIDEGIKLFND